MGLENRRNETMKEVKDNKQVGQEWESYTLMGKKTN